MELGSYFLFLQEQNKDIIIILRFPTHAEPARRGAGTEFSGRPVLEPA
jgi:hypothetical protein